MLKIIFALLLAFGILNSQNTIKERAVFITTEFDNTNTPSIKLKWEQDTNALYYVISRKERMEQKFTEIGRTDSAVYQWTDVNIKKGISYEYQIENYRADFSAYGYINASIEKPLIENRGTFIVFVDNTIYSLINSEISQYKQDLEGDGWNVVIDSTIPRAENFSPEKVKYLKNRFDSYKVFYPDFSAALLVGRIPVAYTGTIAFDGHSDHRGAWPSDLYYGVFGGNWTDTITQTNAIEERNKNVPNDYKFDQYYHDSDVEIAIGRVDAFNLPYFKKNEVELIKNYFIKNHSFRHKLVEIADSAIISHRFDIEYKESFAAMGWMNFTALFGNRISTEFAREAIRKKKYLWMYCDGPGSYISTWDNAYSEEYANFPFNATFSAIFGSYNGDWDSENNLLRSAIFGEPTGLISFWAARPFWFLHTLGMGETFGDVTLLSQNNFANDYPAISPYYRRATHISLLGDPSLKMRYIAPPSSCIATIENNIAHIKWNHSKDSILGYNIYSRNLTFSSRFKKINDVLIKDNFYLDNSDELGEVQYVVRAVKLINSETGSYYDMSQGVFSNSIILPKLDTTLNFDWKIGPNPTSELLNLSIFTKNTTTIECKLYDNSGKNIYSKDYKILNGFNFLILELKNNENQSLSQGSYFLKIQYDRNEIIRKIQIMK